ncbi:hypothetical protein Q3G72_025509 [Acer saccharum]|nr:hypothetical protein Q3G72_025509 [Acer saccharum]
MLKLASLKFAALEVSGENYMSWVIDTKLLLKSEGLYYTIENGADASEQDKSTAMVIIRHHLHEDLKAQYLTVTEPDVLWQELKDQFDNQPDVALPNARYQWQHLRFQDFKSVSEYNSALFKITTQLKLCAVSRTAILKIFRTYLMFLVAEKNNELLIKNHESRPTGSTAFPEVNANTIGGHTRGRGCGRGSYHGRGRGRGRGPSHGWGWGCGRGRGRGRGRGPGHEGSYGYFGPNTPQKWNVYKVKPDKGKSIQKEPKKDDSVCFRCGCHNHWSRTCRTPKHLVELYQASIKEKGKEKNPETNFLEDSDFMDVQFDVSDFLNDPT